MTLKEILYYDVSLGSSLHRAKLKNLNTLHKEHKTLKELPHSKFFKLVSDRSNIPIGTIKAVIDSINNTYESIKDEYKVTLPLIISVR